MTKKKIGLFVVIAIVISAIVTVIVKFRKSLPIDFLKHVRMGR